MDEVLTAFGHPSQGVPPGAVEQLSKIVFQAAVTDDVAVLQSLTKRTEHHPVVQEVLHSAMVATEEVGQASVREVSPGSRIQEQDILHERAVERAKDEVLKDMGMEHMSPQGWAKFSAWAAQPGGTGPPAGGTFPAASGGADDHIQEGQQHRCAGRRRANLR